MALHGFHGRYSGTRTLSAASLLPLARLLQLASPALPVGAYTYSQGLEWAVQCGTVSDEASAGQWIGDFLELGLGRFELPLLAAALTAWQTQDTTRLDALDALFLASREAAELRAETVQMGFSLRRLARELGDPCLEPLLAWSAPRTEVSFPLLWAGFARAWALEEGAALAAYLWSWAENQVIAALKAVPLGQAAGQRLLAGLGARIPQTVAAALALPPASWCNTAPALAIASCRHETQYSRLFRS